MVIYDHMVICDHVLDILDEIKVVFREGVRIWGKLIFQKNAST